MEQRPKFFMCRYPDDESQIALKRAQSKLNKLGGFRQGQRAHLTYTGDKLLDGRTKQIGAETLNSFIHPLPKTALEPLTLAVRGLRSRPSRVGVPHIFIALEDSEKTYEAEQRAVHSRIEGRLRTRKFREVPPHVTLGKIPLASLSMEALDDIEADLPDAITFSPMSYPVYTDENVGPVPAKNGRLRPLSETGEPLVRHIAY